MSRAFVKEADGDTPDDDLPEKRAGAGPNYLTADGLAELRAQLNAALAQQQSVGATPSTKSKALSAQLAREIRFLRRRIDEAVVVERASGDVIAIGSTVTILVDGDDRRQTLTIVGEDQADPAAGKISWSSPLGRALTGARRGVTVRWPRPAGDADVVIVDVV